MAKYKEWLDDDNLLRLSAWARDGLSDKQIAHNMGIAYSTFREWKAKYPAIAAALKFSKEVADIEVENALYKRAMGYTYKEITKELRDKEIIITKEIYKHMPPDTTAQIYWLSNRKNDNWKRNPDKDERHSEPIEIIIKDDTKEYAE